jgi:hypothetical protein
MYYAMLGKSAGLPVLIEIVGEFPDAYEGVPYDEELPIIGGTPPYTVTNVSGSVPPGLTLEASVDGLNARLHGTPLSDIYIDGELPDATVGVAYSERLQVFNHVGTVTPTIVAGAMPSWMSMTWHSGTSEIEFHGMPT